MYIKGILIYIHAILHRNVYIDMAIQPSLASQCTIIENFPGEPVLHVYLNSESTATNWTILRHGYHKSVSEIGKSKTLVMSCHDSNLYRAELFSLYYVLVTRQVAWCESDRTIAIYVYFVVVKCMTAWHCEYTEHASSWWYSPFKRQFCEVFVSGAQMCEFGRRKCDLAGP